MLGVGPVGTGRLSGKVLGQGMLFQRRRRPVLAVDGSDAGDVVGLTVAGETAPAKASDASFMPDRLNVGCGYDKREGYLNVDMDPACAPDVLIIDNDLSVLPRRHFSEVLANDVLEHIPRSQTLSALLEWADLMAPGGALKVSTSSILGVAAQMAGKSYADQYNWTRCLFGNQVQPGDYHLSGFTEATLKTHLLAAGFLPGTISLDDGWLFRLSAEKVEDWTDLLEEPLGEEAFIDGCFRRMLYRDPDEGGVLWGRAELAAGKPRRSLLKHLASSEERLYKTAERNEL